MIKYIKYLFIIIIVISFVAAKKSRLTNDATILKQEPYSLEEIEQLKELYLSEEDNIKVLETLINIYKDHNQIYNVRMAALNILSDINNPLVLDALQETIENIEFIEFDFLIKSIEILHKNNSLNTSESFIKGLKNSENKIIDLRTKFINSVGENGSEDAILTLIDLYEISLSNHARMNELMSLTLGNMNDDRAIPVLMKIINDKNINIRIRNQAVEILAKKDAPELVDYFIEMLGDPETNEEMLNFINNSMGDLHNDRLVLALIESFETGKNRYFASLHSLMTSLNNYDNPQMKPGYIQIINNDSFPRLLRIKAIQGLANFNDPTVLDEIIPILDNPDNYEFYFEILNLVNMLDAPEIYKNKIRKIGHQAMKDN